MKSLYRLVIGFAVSALLPATAGAQKVRYDFERDADFARLKTFAFQDPRSTPTVSEETTMYDSPFIKEHTLDAIAAQLQARGMTRDDNNPDVYVTARRSYKAEYVSHGPYYSVGYPWGWGYDWGWSGGVGYGGPMYTEEIMVGTLTIDIKDAATNELIWRGTGEKDVNDTSKPEKRIRRVNREVAKIFRNFPPGRDIDDD